MNNWLECLEYTITTYNKVMKNELLKIYKQNQIARQTNELIFK